MQKAIAKTIEYRMLKWKNRCVKGIEISAPRVMVAMPPHAKPRRPGIFTCSIFLSLKSLLKNPDKPQPIPFTLTEGNRERSVWGRKRAAEKRFMKAWLTLSSR